VITLDGYAASHRAVDKLKTSGILPRRVQVRSCKYLNNVIEQDHRRIKQRVRPMLGFKRFETAAVTIRGIELAEKIKKQQFSLKPLAGQATTAPGIWEVLQVWRFDLISWADAPRPIDFRTVQVAPV
jgi:transposase-like protein